jgi:hypothetical protein
MHDVNNEYLYSLNKNTTDKFDSKVKNNNNINIFENNQSNKRNFEIKNRSN